MKILSLTFLIFSISACMPVQEVAETTPGYSNKNAPQLWGDKTFPKTLRVSSNFSADEVDNITEMADAWSHSIENHKILFSFGSPVPEITNGLTDMERLSKDASPIFGIYKSENWPPELKATSPFALAVTQTYGMRHNIGESNEFVEIHHADILINYEMFDFDTEDSGWGYDLRTVVLHELGHFLGMAHRQLPSSERDNSVMYPSIGHSEAKRYPRPMDISDLATKYGITLGSSGGAGNYAIAPRSVYKADPNKPSQGIRILMELHADGNCVHRVEGKIVEEHRVDPAKFRK